MCGEWRQQGQSSLLVTLSLTGCLFGGHGRPAIRSLRQDVLARETGEARFCLSGSRACPPLAGCPVRPGVLGVRPLAPLGLGTGTKVEVAGPLERGGASPQ